MTSYGLDILGRVVAEKAGAATVRTHVYDTAGRKLSANVTLPRPPTGVTGLARTVSMDFIYDADGNRVGASWDGVSIGWAYDGLNRVTGVDLGAEAVTRHVYDRLGRRTDTTRGAATSQYTYDIAGQLKGLKHVWSGASLTAGYLYDDAGSMVSEALDNQAFLWQPAATLARTTRYDDASPINALTKVDGVAQVHDGRGNRTGAAGRTWRYDSRNMLVGANAPGMAASYGYYPEGGRAWKQVNGVTTLYLELDGVEWGSYDAAGTLKERTIRASGAGGAVVAVHSQAGGLIRLLPNRQGSVIGWLRPDGTLGGAYTYDAYGNSAQAGAGGPSFRYAGMRFDAETGLYHTPFRAYDPQDGRWMQLDPIGIKDGLNRYAYVKNSPLMGVDPTGLYQCKGSEDACRSLDEKVKNFQSAVNNIDRTKYTKSELKRLDNLNKKLDETGARTVVFTEGKTKNEGAYAEATSAYTITFDHQKMNTDISNRPPVKDKDVSKLGAGVVGHEVSHAYDQEYGIISGRGALKATEQRAFNVQVIVERELGVSHGLIYDSSQTKEQMDERINNAADKSVDSACRINPGYCR